MNAPTVPETPLNGAPEELNGAGAHVARGA